MINRNTPTFALALAKVAWPQTDHVIPAWWDCGYHALAADGTWLGNVELDGLDPATVAA